MKNLCVIPLIAVLFGCASTERSVVPSEQPELVSMVPFPTFTSSYATGGLRLSVLLHVMEDGRINEVKMLGSSGSAAWDSSAIQSIKQWRFTVPHRNGVPVDTWFRQAIVVQFQEPAVRVLGELAVTRQDQADSLYQLIKAGKDFEALARQASVSLHGHCGFLGSVDLAMFPKQIRDKLQDLKVNDITTPIRVADKFIIYKRFEKNDPMGATE